MTSGEKPVIVTKNPSFNEVVDEACDRLMDSQVKYSIRKIQQMSDNLDELEMELDIFLSNKNGK